MNVPTRSTKNKLKQGSSNYEKKKDCFCCPIRPRFWQLCKSHRFVQRTLFTPNFLSALCSFWLQFYTCAKTKERSRNLTISQCKKHHERNLTGWKTKNKLRKNKYLEQPDSCQHIDDIVTLAVNLASFSWNHSRNKICSWRMNEAEHKRDKIWELHTLEKQLMSRQGCAPLLSDRTYWQTIEICDCAKKKVQQLTPKCDPRDFASVSFSRPSLCSPICPTFSQISP